MEQIEVVDRITAELLKSNMVAKLYAGELAMYIAQAYAAGYDYRHNEKPKRSTDEIENSSES
jgi:23S rRNA U2552 (ribose-2'-O)-methylase RlmE/FtsJ